MNIPPLRRSIGFRFSSFFLVIGTIIAVLGLIIMFIYGVGFGTIFLPMVGFCVIVLAALFRGIKRVVAKGGQHMMCGTWIWYIVAVIVLVATINIWSWISNGG